MRPRRRLRSLRPFRHLLLLSLLLSFLALLHKTTKRRRAIIAYFIQASASNADQVPRLLRVLCDTNSPRSPFAIHFDAALDTTTVTQTLTSARTELGTAGCPRAQIIHVPAEHVTYRGITLALNYLTGASALIQSGIHFDYFINLSGADYPTARPSLIADLLSTYAVQTHRLSFIEWKPQDKWHRFARGRLGRIFIDSALASGIRGIYSLPPEEEKGFAAAPPEWRNPLFPHVGFTVAKSSGWFIWHRELVEYLLLGAAPRRMVGVFALSDAADEHIFASAVWNSEYFKSRSVPSNLRNIFFTAPNGSSALADDGVTRSKQHPYYVDDVDEDGKLLFWDELWGNPAFFSRKVRKNGLITDRIDSDILGITYQVDLRRRNDYEQRLRQSFLTQVNEHIRMMNIEDKKFKSIFKTD